MAAAGNHAYPFSLVAAPGAYPHLPIICADPASQPAVICVSATDKRELPAALYTGLAINEGMLAVSAPGGAGLGATLGGDSCSEAILTTHPGALPAMCWPGAGFEQVDGTSFATPHVAAVAALLSSMGCDDAEIKGVMLGSARTPGLNARGVYTPLWGYGIVDAGAAVTTAAGRC